jgi:hypothetical protein
MRIRVFEAAEADQIHQFLQQLGFGLRVMTLVLAQP